MPKQIESFQESEIFDESPIKIDKLKETNTIKNSQIIQEKYQERLLTIINKTNYCYNVGMAQVKHREEICNLDNFFTTNGLQIIEEKFGKEFLKTNNISIFDLANYYQEVRDFYSMLKPNAINEAIKIIEKFDVKNEKKSINFNQDHLYISNSNSNNYGLVICFLGFGNNPKDFNSSFAKDSNNNYYSCYNESFWQIFANKLDFERYNEQYWQEISSLIDNNKYSNFKLFSHSMGAIKLSNFLEFLHKKLGNEKILSDEKDKISYFLNNLDEINIVNPAQSLEPQHIKSWPLKFGAYLRKTILYDAPNFFKNIVNQVNRKLGKELIEYTQDHANISFIKDNLLIEKNEEKNEEKNKINNLMPKLQTIKLGQCKNDEVLQPLESDKFKNEIIKKYETSDHGNVGDARSWFAKNCNPHDITKTFSIIINNNKNNNLEKIKEDKLSKNYADIMLPDMNNNTLTTEESNEIPQNNIQNSFVNKQTYNKSYQSIFSI